MNILQLRSEIEVLLADQLGLYTLSNGETTPAISVRAEGEALPAGQTADGLEAVIIRDPDLTAIPQYSEAGTLRRWVVYLVVWNTYVEIETAIDRMVYTYAGSRVDTVPVPRGTGPLHQTRITFPGPPPLSSTMNNVYVTGVFESDVFV